MARLVSFESLKVGRKSPAHHGDRTGACGNVPILRSSAARAVSIGRTATDDAPNSLDDTCEPSWLSVLRISSPAYAAPPAGTRKRATTS